MVERISLSSSVQVFQAVLFWLIRIDEIVNVSFRLDTAHFALLTICESISGSMLTGT
jgi:hypothetical protein